MLGVCLVLRPQASGQVTSRTGEQSDLRPIDPGLCRRQRGWQRFKYKASAASYSAPTLLEPMETAVVDICLRDREKTCSNKTKAKKQILPCWTKLALEKVGSYKSSFVCWFVCLSEPVWPSGKALGW